MSLADWLPTFLSWLAPILIGLSLYAGRSWIKARIDNRISVQGAKELEAYRTELRAEKEQISALRETVLSGQANRQAMVDQRRIEAVARIWQSVGEFAAYRYYTEMLQKVDLDAAVELAPNDPTIQEFFAGLLKFAIPPKDFSNSAASEEPFISPVAWALYKTYATIATNAYAVIAAFEHRVNPLKLLKMEQMAELAKEVLPHQAKLFDDHGPTAAYFLLDEIKQKLLNELRSELDGKKIDRNQLEQAAEITKQATSISDADSAYASRLKAQIPAAIQVDDPE